MNLSMPFPHHQADARCIQIMMTHSKCVWHLAERLARASRFADAIDYDFLQEACMLHDCGIVWVDAPSIFCFGEEHYMRHGALGAAWLRSIDAKRYARAARVCERHIGTGLTAQEIVAEALPLDPVDLLPETFEEKLVTYADNFYSKDPARLTQIKSYDRVAAGISRFGEAPLKRLQDMRELFGDPDSLA